MESAISLHPSHSHSLATVLNSWLLSGLIAALLISPHYSVLFVSPTCHCSLPQEIFHDLSLCSRGSGGQTNTPSVPGKTGKRRGRPPKRKKLLEENLLRYEKAFPRIEMLHAAPSGRKFHSIAWYWKSCCTLKTSCGTECLLYPNIIFPAGSRIIVSSAAMTSMHYAC